MAAGDFLSSIELISPTEFAKKKIQSLQDYSILAAESVANLFRRPRYAADMMQQMDLIGFGSLRLCSRLCSSRRAALALNSATSLSRFGATTVIGQLVSIGIVRELGPGAGGARGRRTEFFGDGERTRLHDRHRTDRRDACARTDPLKKLVTRAWWLPW